MPSAFSWQNCQPLPCFILYSKAKFACYSRYFLISYFCIPVPFSEKDIFLGVSSRRSCRSSQNHSTSTSSTLTGCGLDLAYRGTEWFPLETNRDHSVIFEIAPKYCISDSFVDYVATPFPLSDLAHSSRHNGHLSSIHPFKSILVC